MDYQIRLERQGGKRNQRGGTDKNATKIGGSELADTRTDPEAIIRHSGRIGLTRLETADRLRIPLNDFVANKYFMAIYADAFCEHRVAVMQKLFEKATVDGDMKAIVYLAEHHLGRGKQEAEDKRLEALQHVLNLSPEERRARIVELTKKLGVA